MMKNAIVVDLEPWDSIELLRDHVMSEPVDQVRDSVRPILEVLDRCHTKATFAVLGSLALKHPELIREIYDNGHEIASHAWSHKTLYELGKDGFDDEIKMSVEILESITGVSPVGFRAPSFSINNSTKWAFEILEKYGFEYDASVFPIKTMLYGVPNAPLNIYRPSRNDVAKDDPNGRILEFPMTVLNLSRINKNIPIAGGFYLRLLPLWFLKYGIRAVNKERPAILYIHPWETYAGTPRLRIPQISRFVTYYGISSALNKFANILSEFNFAPISEVLINWQSCIDQKENVGV